MAFERCHDPEELQRLVGGAALGVRRRVRRRHGRRRRTRRHGHGRRCREATMSETYQYKVRDKSGNLVTGTLVADNELPGPRSASARWATRPLEVGKEKKGLNLEINIKPGEGQAQGAGGLLAAVRHDGQLGPADPARAVDPGRADREQGAREDADDVRGSTSSRARRCRRPWRSTRRSFNDLYIVDGEVRRDGRLARRRAAAPGRRCSRARSTCAARSSRP